LLSTLSFDNAVTVGYKPENVYLKRTFTALIVHHLRRTGMPQGGRSGNRDEPIQNHFV
jgi:hypothetical protein